MTNPTLLAILTRIATGVFVVSIPIFLVTTNVRVLATETWFYEEGFRRHEADVATGIEMDELDAAAGQIADYFSNDADTLRIVVVEDGEEVALFDARETEHMEDVKGLMTAVYRLNEVALAAILIYIPATALWTREKSAKTVSREALMGVAVGFALVAVVGVLAFAGFDSAWTTFHEIAFRNDLWQLDPDTDHLIQMFPEPLWEEATFLVAALTLMEVALVVAVASVTLLLARRKERPVADVEDLVPVA
ncbi:MAG TPA: TIGR01906 family membrane protein [Tepidiformaceae bacterium]|nr:TIGR01906 family membrane protein [Tepidiformaceae bacterium]